jgi:hypothetical protein
MMANVPGFNALATLMKQTFKNKGVATVEQLRDMCVEMDVRLIGCQMTMDVLASSGGLHQGMRNRRRGDLPGIRCGCRSSVVFMKRGYEWIIYPLKQITCKT